MQGGVRIVRAADNDSRECVVSAPLEVTAGTDYFEIEVEQSSGGALDVDVSNHTWAAIYAVQYTSFRGALVRSTANQSLTSGIHTAIAFDAEEYDTDTIHDNATNNTRLTVPTGVTRVRVTCNVSFASNGAGIRRLHVRKNGAEFNGGAYSQDDVSGTTIHWLNASTGVLSVAGGDYFECYAQQTSGGALNVTFDESTWGALEVVE